VEGQKAVKTDAGSDVGFGLSQAGDAIAGLPLTTLFEDGDAFESFENVTFCAGGAGGAQAAML
jgi:hypothetical protein